MINDDFYPSAWSDSNVQGSPTALMQDIPITTPEFTQAYWLGWVLWENLPQQYKISRYNIVNGRGVFTDVTRAENIPVGYTVNDDGSYSPAKINAAILANNGEKWQNITYPNHTVTAGNNVRLPNSLNVNTVGYNGVVILGFVGYANTTEISGWVSIGINDFINDSNFTVTFTNGYVFTAKPSDFAEYTLTEFDDNDTHYSVALGMYKIDYVRDVTIYGGSYGYQGIRSMLQTHTTDDKSYIQSLTYPVHYQNNNTFNWGSGETGQGAYIDFSGNVGAGMVQNTDGENVDIMGGFVGEFDIASMISNGIIHPENATFYIRGIGRSDLAIIGRIFTYTEIYKTLALTPRIAVNGVNQYVNSANFLYAKVDLETNEFLTDFVSGDKIRELTDWQIIGGNINTDDFNADDIPEYEPTEDGTDSGGDDIRPSDWTNLRISAANNFVTLYGMNAATVADFGRQLWANLADPAFWQMVGTVFTNDFSINPADLMKYFISLRYFPFDVSDFAHSTATGVYVGRAATPIAPTPNQNIPYPIRVTNNVIQVDGGRLTISRYYNDFRDYEPCTTVQIHVPFCGSVDVPASEVMGHEMDLTYKIDLQTGAMLAVLGVASNTYYVIATVAGTCGASIPITANNNIEFLQRIATVGSGLIGGGVSGAVKGATVGGEVGAVVGAVAGTVGGGVGALAGLPPVTVHKQGNASGFANLGGVPYAYATVQRGRFERPANYGHTTGFACDFSATIGSLSGFTVCDNVDTSGLTCNADERDEIKRLLESGVYV